MNSSDCLVREAEHRFLKASAQNQRKGPGHTPASRPSPPTAQASHPISFPCRPGSFQQPLTSTKNLPKTLSGMFFIPGVGEEEGRSHHNSEF